MNTKIQNEINPPDHIALKATELNSHNAATCPYEKLKAGKAMKDEGISKIRQGEALIETALVELKNLIGDTSPYIHTPAISEPFQQPEVPPRIRKETPSKPVNPRGVKFSLEHCKTLVYDFIVSETKKGNSWIGVQKIGEGTGLSRQPVKRGIEALIRNKKIRKVEKAGNPNYKSWQYKNKRLPYYEIRD